MKTINLDQPPTKPKNGNKPTTTQPQLQSDSPTATAKATQIAALNAAYVAYPTQRDYFTIGGPGGLN